MNRHSIPPESSQELSRSRPEIGPGRNGEASAEKGEFFEYLAQFITEHKLHLFDQIVRNRTRHLTVVLEDIYQPHNASACLRSCDCFGIQDVHIIEDQNSYRINRDVALGAGQWLTLIKHNEHANNTTACYRRLQERGYRILATTPHRDECSLEELDVQRPTALVFGNELNGLSPTALEQADGFVQIPMFGFTESFNISVSVALCLHHLTWKLRNSNVDWQLDEQEIFDIKLDWAKQVLRDRISYLERDFLKRRQSETGSSD